MAVGAAVLARSARQTLAEQLAGRYAERIRQRLLAPGARLPSVRECARRHAVSPSTVVAAYDQLLAHGLVEARRQRGFFVRESDARRRARRPGVGAGPTRPPAIATEAARAAPAASAAGQRHRADPRHVPAAAAARPMPGLGTLPAEWLDAAMLRGAAPRDGAGQVGARAARRPALQLRRPGRRRAPARRAGAKLADFGMPATPAQIVTTVGATHALDIVTRTPAARRRQRAGRRARLVGRVRAAGALGMRVLPAREGSSRTNSERSRSRQGRH